MIKRKKCSNCNKKVNKKFDYCPFCGESIQEEIENEKDYGLLGKNDLIPKNQSLQRIPLVDKILSRMLTSVFSNLEKEIQKNTRRNSSFPEGNFQLFINGKKINLSNPSQNNQPEKQTKKNTTKFPIFSSDQIKKIQNLNKIEPKTSLKRFSDKIIYEIILPGVKNLKDISILPLEESIEIKAISNENYYKKTIPISLKINNYLLKEETLLIEFNISDKTEQQII